MDLSKARTVTSEEGVTYTPWTDGWAVGFRVTRTQDDRVEYVVLNPSGGGLNDGEGDVFTYHLDTPLKDDGPGDVVAAASPVVYVNVFEVVPQ
jgi:hypothetical protein